MAGVKIQAETGHYPHEIKILIVEDNLINQKVITAMLSKSGYQYELVDDGHKAISKFETGDYSLILMDCQLPDLNGMDATRKIRHLEKESTRKRVPIVALTANTMSGDREICLESGMDDFLSKPFKLNELLQKIHKWSPS